MNEFSVTPLGTVSPYPKGKCNGPGFLVKSGKFKILLDCGSAVSSMLSFPEDLNDLMIILSHLHIDHYSDLGSFANASFCYHNLGMLDKKVKVYYPYHYLHNEKIMKCYEENSFMDFDSYSNLNSIEFGDMKMSFIRSVHDVVTYGVKIMSNFVSVVYTSDTGFNEDLIEFCKGADLLISESTFLRGQSCTKGHMYAYQAGILANEAGVKQLMLTHFWPEISKEKYVNEAKEYFENVIAANEGEKLVLRKGDF